MTDEPQEIARLRRTLVVTNYLLYAIALLAMVFTFNTCAALDRLHSRLWDVNDKLGDVAHSIRMLKP